MQILRTNAYNGRQLDFVCEASVSSCCVRVCFFFLRVWVNKFCQLLANRDGLKSFCRGLRNLFF